MSEKPKISLIVPHWPLFPHNDEQLKNCIQSMPPVYEKIIIVNDGTGMGKAINKGFELATGDFFMVSNNDCHYLSGDLYEMCDPEAITIPDNMPGQWDSPRSFYCLPKWVWEKLGGYDEQFEVGYFEDDDLIRRWEEAGIPIRMTKVNIAHEGSQTLDKMDNRNEVFLANKEKFERKWNQ